jgi:hypothetical protein
MDDVPHNSNFDYGDVGPDGQHERHPGLPEVFPTQQPIRYDYIHNKCGVETRMPSHCARTYAVDPNYYSMTFCVGCKDYFPVSEFVWKADRKPINQKLGVVE